MTEEIQGMGVAQPDAPAETDVTSVGDSTHVETGVSEDVSSAEQEKMIPQSQVNKLMARQKREAEERARHRYESQQQSVAMSHQNGPLNAQQVDELVQNRFLMQRAQEIEQQFTQKIQAAMYSDPEFADLYDSLNLEKNPTLGPMVMWANEMDNTADVLKEIAKNPSKFANILMLLQSAPALAKREMVVLSSSIKKNQEALKQKQAKPPLEQLKPSTTVTSSGNKKWTVSELRRKF
jgi:hypothetical protein